MDNTADIATCRDLLKDQLEKAKGSLNRVDSNLQKFLTSKLPPANRPMSKRFDSNSDKWKTANDNGYKKNELRKNDLRNSLIRRKMNKAEAENIPIKRRLDIQPRMLQCSISGPPVVADYRSDEDDAPVRKKPVLSSCVVQKPVIIPSRREAVSAKTNSETRARDRRMFGALLGTLKKFRQEENQLKDKIDKKARVEQKLEEAAKQERERIRNEKKNLFQAKKDRESYIIAVELHLALVKDQEKWEEIQKPMFNFIRTKTEPYVYYLPVIQSDETKKLLEESRELLTKEIEEKRNAVKASVNQILERWHIDNLDQIPDVFQEPPPKSTSPVCMPFENIHATVTVKPQKSPVSYDEDDRYSSDVLLDYGAVRIKEEKLDFDECTTRNKFNLNENNANIKDDGNNNTEEKEEEEDENDDEGRSSETSEEIDENIPNDDNVNENDETDTNDSEPLVSKGHIEKGIADKNDKKKTNRLKIEEEYKSNSEKKEYRDKKTSRLSYDRKESRKEYERTRRRSSKDRKESSRNKYKNNSQKMNNVKTNDKPELKDSEKMSNGSVKGEKFRKNKAEDIEYKIRKNRTRTSSSGSGSSSSSSSSGNESSERSRNVTVRRNKKS